jgi:hypothetical protein
MSWSMRKDRQLIKLARARLSVEKIAHLLDVSPPQVVKSARRLGVSLSPKPPKPDGRLKAKPKRPGFPR